MRDKEIVVEVNLVGLDTLEKKVQELNEIVAKAKSLAEEIALTTITISSQMKN